MKIKIKTKRISVEYDGNISWKNVVIILITSIMAFATLLAKAL